MEFDVWADGTRIKSRDDAEAMRGLNTGEAYDRLRAFLSSGELAGDIVVDDIQPLDSSDWGEPYEAFAKPEGSVKHIVTDVLMDAESWVEMQAVTHRKMSAEAAIEGANESTTEAVTTAIDTGDTQTLSEIPMPVLEIYMDNTSNHAEGRSRGVGVLRSKRDYIPIRVASRVYK